MKMVQILIESETNPNYPLEYWYEIIEQCIDEMRIDVKWDFEERETETDKWYVAIIDTDDEDIYWEIVNKCSALDVCGIDESGDICYPLQRRFLKYN